MPISDQTTLGKEFNKVLQSQNKVNVFFHTLPDEYMLNASGEKAPSRVTVDAQGYASGVPGVGIGSTSPVIIYDMEGFREYDATYGGTGIAHKEIQAALQKGQGIILVGVSLGMINARPDMNMERLANFRASGAETLLHEEWAHVMPQLLGLKSNEYTEHKAYHGDFGKVSQTLLT